MVLDPDHMALLEPFICQEATRKLSHGRMVPTYKPDDRSQIHCLRNKKSFYHPRGGRTSDVAIPKLRSANPQEPIRSRERRAGSTFPMG